MPLLTINIKNAQIDLSGAMLRQVRSAVDATDATAPIVLLIHGFKYDPESATTSPHRLIYALDPEPVAFKVKSWPRHLGVGGAGPEPLCVAVGWEARGHFRQVYRRAADTGRAIATLINFLARLRPGHKIDVLTHSLGARVALSALPHLPEGRIGQLILMAPAEFRHNAAEWLDCSAGQEAQILSIASRANALFDRLLEWSIAPHLLHAKAIGLQAPLHHCNWDSLSIDDPKVRAALEAVGFPVDAPDKRICHWNVYLREGLFPLYRAIFDGSLPVSKLRTILPDSPRSDWSPVKKRASQWEWRARVPTRFNPLRVFPRLPRLPQSDRVATGKW